MLALAHVVVVAVRPKPRGLQVCRAGRALRDAGFEQAL